MNKNKLSLIIGIFLILAIGVTIILIQQGILTVTRARLTSIPENIQITNISDASFTVVYKTGLQSLGAIKISSGNTSSTIVLDDRDKSSGIQNKYFSHHVTIPNLEPQKTYTFTILSDGKEYTSPAQYLATTGKAIASAPPSQNPLYGNVLLPDGNTGSDVIVIAESENSQVISSITDNTGSYILPTNSLKNESLSEYLKLNPNSQIFLTFAREQYSAKITANFDIGQNLPIITLNQRYAFSPSEPALVNKAEEGFDTDQVTESTTEPTVISPENNQSFIDQRPTFSGTGGINKKVQVTIPSENINETIDISAQRRWTFRPENPISQGDHTVQFNIQDDNGINVRINRSFSIFPSGSQLVETATPSATPAFTPTPTITATPTLSPTLSPTVSVTPAVTLTPTIAISITPTSTPSVTLTPTIATSPTLIPTATPLPPIDKPGSVSSTAILGIFSIILIVAGAAIFFAL